MAAREYLLRRRLVRLGGGGPGGGGASYGRVDECDGTAASLRRWPSSLKRSVRVADHLHHQLVMQGETPGSVRVRARYREDPMMPIPGFLYRLMLDRLLPRAIAALVASGERYMRQMNTPGVSTTVS